MSINDTAVGRNVEEYFRILQAFQHNEQHGEVCPASWKPGKATLKPGQANNEYWEKVHAKH